MRHPASQHTTNPNKTMSSFFTEVSITWSFFLFITSTPLPPYLPLHCLKNWNKISIRFKWTHNNHELWLKIYAVFFLSGSFMPKTTKTARQTKAMPTKCIWKYKEVVYTMVCSVNGLYGGKALRDNNKMYNVHANTNRIDIQQIGLV